MSILKPVLILVILSATMVCNNAWATDPPPRPGATRPAPDPAAPAKETNEAKEANVVPKAKPAPAQARRPRRAVRQLDNGMPPRPAPPALAMPAPPAVPPPALPQPVPSPRTQDGSYKSGVGNALISPQGKLCSDNGITVQCF